MTNDFRIFLVKSQVAPTTLSQVQHLTLHGTNVVISDTLNILNSLSIDAQNLTLTTNGPGNGATSTDGELNFQSSAILWPAALPNLLNLTNNGAIRVLNQAQFIGASNAVSVTPPVPGVAATGTLSEVYPTKNVAVNNTVTIGTYTYTFVNTIKYTATTVTNQVKIAATFNGSMSNLIAAINNAAGSGTSYSSNSTANPLVTAGLLTSHSFTVTATFTGSIGNAIVTTNSTATMNLTWNGQSTLSGGVDYVAGTTNTSTVSVPYNNFINNGLVSDLGSAIYANNFENGGPFSCGANGSFALQSVTTVLTNGSVTAGGDVSITAASLVTSNLFLSAGRSLVLQVTNQLTDSGAVNPNVWSVGGSGLVGLNLPIKPQSGDLLGTTISCTVLTNKTVVNTWAGNNYGVSTLGYFEQRSHRRAGFGRAGRQQFLPVQWYFHRSNERAICG